MSCYQYYEFLALDGPISEEGLQYAQNCSSRAEVSQYRWVNSYHWGDFHGSEETLLKYYDAFYYFADWGSFRFSLAFPEAGSKTERFEPYTFGEHQEFGASLTYQASSNRHVLTWQFQEEEVCHDGCDDMGGMLGRLATIREQIIQGDDRALFMAWLAGFDPEWVEDENTLIPPIPPGMNSLTDGLRLLAEQMQLEDDVLKAAAELSSGQPLPESLPVKEVVDALTEEEMKRLLVDVMEGAGDRVKAELIQRSLPVVSGGDTTLVTCGDFAARVLETREEIRLANQRKRERKQQEAERKQWLHLAHVYKTSESMWERLDQLLEKKTASVYDVAAKRIKELHDAYDQAGDAGEFAGRLSLFRGRYGRRPALMRRLAELDGISYDG